MKRLWWTALGLLLAACAPQRPAAAPAPAEPGRWEADVQRFQAEDRANPPAPGGVLFVGSSSIRLWNTLQRDFPSVRTLNRGFGGSEMADAVALADRIILPYRPSMVVVYAGDNDLAAGKTPERVLADYQTLVRAIHARLPEARVAFIAIKPSPSRWSIVDRVREANERVRRFSEQDPRLSYIDIFTPMLGPDGTPRPELFVQDRLHLSEQGYALWRSVVAPYVEGGAR